MTKGIYYISAAIVLLLITLSVTSKQFTLFLAPDIDITLLPRAISGATILKISFFIDSILLLLIGLYLHNRNTRIDNKEYQPLWTPSRKHIHLFDDFRFYQVSFYSLLALALVLRIINLNSDLWIDEVFTVIDFVRLPAGEILTSFTSDNQHPFFSFLSHISVVLFGESPWAVRLPSVFFGIASIWAAMNLAKLVYGKRVAFYTGLLLTISYHHIWFSQNARGYAILLFGTILSTLFLLRALETGKWRYWIAYALVIAFSAWAHITAVFVSLAHGVTVLILLIRTGNLKKGIWKPAAGFALAAWFTLHIYSLILPQMIDFFMRPGAGTGTMITEWRSPLWLFNEAFHSMGISLNLGWFAIIILFMLTGVAAYGYARLDWVFLLSAVLPGVLLGSTMLLLGRNLWPRMFLNEIAFVMIFFVVAVLISMNYLGQKLRYRLPRLVKDIPLITVAIFFIISLPSLYRYPKQDFTGARDYVLRNMNQNDTVVGIHMAGRMYKLYYAKQWAEVNTVEELINHQSKNAHTWVLYTLSKHLTSTKPQLMGLLKKDYKILKIFPGTLGDGSIFVARSNR